MIALFVPALPLGTAPAQAASDPPDVIHYVALGDSYSSGEGLHNTPVALCGRFPDQCFLKTVPGGMSSYNCHRDRNAYPELFSTNAYHQGNYLGDPVLLDLFAACSGARTEHIYPKRQHKNELTYQAGHNELNSETNLVSVTIGGNDAGGKPTSPNGKQGGLSRPLTYCYTHSNCQKSLRKQLPSPATLSRKLYNAYSAIEAKAPYATIVVLGYPYLFPTDRDTNLLKMEQSCAETDFVGFAFTAKEQDALNTATDGLDDVIKETVNRWNASHLTLPDGKPHLRFGDVRGYFKGHASCDMNGLPNWTNGLFTNALGIPQRHDPRNFHPTALGQVAYGDFLFGFLCNIVQYDTDGKPCPPPTAQ